MKMLFVFLSLIADDPSYRRDVAPILAKHCTVCHNDQSLDDPETSGGLSLDSYVRVTASKKAGIVRLKKSAESELVKRLTMMDAKKRMPKDEPALSSKEIELVKRWIDAGAPEGSAAPEYRRREAGRKSTLRELVVKLDITAPAKSLGQPAAAPLAIELPIQPLMTPTAIALSPDGSRLAVGGHRRLVLWNLKNGAVERQWTDPVGMVTAVAFSSDGKRLFLTGGEAGLSGELRSYLIDQDSVEKATGLATDVLTGLAVHPDGKRIAVCGMDRRIRLLNAADHRELWAFQGHSDAAWCVAFSRDGTKLVSGGKDKSVKVWNTETGKVEQTMTGARDEVLTAVFSPDGAAVISGGKEPQLRIARLGAGGRVTLSTGHGIAMNHIAWNSNFSKFASAGADRSVRVWKPNGTLERNLPPSPDVIHACAISMDGKAAYGAAGDGVVYVWSVEGNRMVARLFVGDPGSGKPAPWAATAVNGTVSISPDLAVHSNWIVGTQEVPLKNSPAYMVDAKIVAEAMRGSANLKPPFPAPSVPKKKPTPKAAVPKKIAAVN
jgi:hypothetical protein